MPGKFRSSFPPGGLKPARRRTSGRLRKNSALSQPHLVLLDIMLPFYNGYYWCGEIRKVSRVPVIFLSSASDNMNIIMAVNQGADDFVAKPFDMGILTAKIQALLRRTYDYGIQTEILEHRGAVLNTGDATLRYEGRGTGTYQKRVPDPADSDGKPGKSGEPGTADGAPLGDRQLCG